METPTSNATRLSRKRVLDPAPRSAKRRRTTAAPAHDAKSNPRNPGLTPRSDSLSRGLNSPARAVAGGSVRVRTPQTTLRPAKRRRTTADATSSSQDAKRDQPTLCRTPRVRSSLQRRGSSLRAVRSSSRTLTPFSGRKSLRSALSLRTLPKPHRTSSPYVEDRFIPRISAASLEIDHARSADVLLDDATSVASPSGAANSSTAVTPTQRFRSILAKELFDGKALDSKLLDFSRRVPLHSKKQNASILGRLRVLYSANRDIRARRRTPRSVSTTPDRILDAPGILDDMYINVLDWSSRNMLAVALGSEVWLWNAVSHDTTLLMETENEDIAITSLRWMNDGSTLALGASDSSVQIWDASEKRRLRTMNGHSARVSALAWNDHVLSSGGADTKITNHDVRVASHLIGTLQGHGGEVCGLSWSQDGSKLASGGNDNVCCVWESRATTTATPRLRLTESKAAVKALGWCPWQRNLLATGGGQEDCCIRFYNTNSGRMSGATETDSQVCSLQWSPHTKEVLTSHGFVRPSASTENHPPPRNIVHGLSNKLVLWNYPTMTQVTEFTGHTDRVLHTALAPEGTMVCSACTDERLRFWTLVEKSQIRGIEMGSKAVPETTMNRTARSIR